jgi:hypothetical protein
MLFAGQFQIKIEHGLEVTVIVPGLRLAVRGLRERDFDGMEKRLQI